MPAGMGEEERFAAAVENGTTPAFRGRDDDSASGFARELEVVALLRSGGAGLRPDPVSRDRARGRLMAAFAQEFGHEDGATDATAPLQVVAPVALATRERTAVRLHDATALRRPRSGRHSAPEPATPEYDDVPDDDTSDDVEAGIAPHNVRRLGSRRADTGRRGGHRRSALIGAAAAAALVALAGGGTFASRDALPGESLYGVKRVAESTSYALTFSKQAKARRHLEQAQHRLDEVEGMVARDRTATAAAGGSATAHSDPELVRSTMQEFDADTDAGARQLLAGSQPDTAQVQEVRTWATQQSERLSGIRSTLPAPDKADESLALLDRVLGQTEALSNGACAPVADGSDVTPAPVDADCAPTGSTPRTGLSSTADAPATDDVKASGGASATARHDDGDTDVETDGDATAGSGDDTGSARTTTRGTSRSDDRDDRDRRSGGGSGASGGGSGSGSGGVSLDLPVPAPPVNVPPVVPGLPGVNLH